MAAPFIYEAKEQDAGILARLAHNTFVETFGKHNTPENMALYLKTNFKVNEIKAEVKVPSTRYYLVKVGKQFAGYMKLGTGTQPEGLKGLKSLEIERIYVQEEFQDEGVGSFMMKFAIKQAEEKGFDVLWLGVWEKNEQAIGFYKKWEFTEFGSHEFILGEDRQTDLLMRKDLVNYPTLDLNW